MVFILSLLTLIDFNKVHKYVIKQKKNKTKGKEMK